MVSDSITFVRILETHSHCQDAGMLTLAERLKHARAIKKWSQSDLAAAAGVSQGTVGNIESGARQSKGSIPQIAEALGVDYKWLAYGTGPEPTPVPALTGPSPVPAPGEAGIPVAMLANSASMGGGADALSEDVLCGQISLAPSFVHDYIRPTRPDALRFVHSYGDSMHPTFSSGDVLLVDTGVREPRIDGVYVLAAHGRLFIKRVRQRMDGSMEVSSDNPGHKTVDTLNGDHAIDVLGRVVWCWNGRKV